MAANDNLEGLIDVRRELDRSSDAIHESVSSMGRLGSEFMNVLNLSKKLTSTLKASIESQTDMTTMLQTYEKSMKSVNELKRQQQIIQKEIVSKERSLDAVDKARYETALKARDIQAKSAEYVARHREELSKSNITQAEILDLNTKIARWEGVAATAAQRYDKALESKNVAIAMFLRIQSETVDKAIELNKEQAKYAFGLKNAFGMMAKSGDKVFKGMKDGLLSGLGMAGGIAGLFSSIVESVFSIDKNLTSIGKNSGLSREATSALLSDYNKTTVSLNTLNSGLQTSLMSYTGMMEAQSELQSVTDQLGLFTQKNVLTQMNLTKQYGLSVEEATKLNQVGLLNNQTTADTRDIIFQQTADLNKANGLRFKGVEILKAVSKIEGVLAVNYKNNPKLIAQAVLQAKALGLSLEQAAQASSSLLDFESSISNELEVELLTGKRWNLEKARSLALDGKSAEAMQEMMKNVGTLADYEKLNVIAKESAAKALGMSSDELSNALRSQELMKNVSKETLQAIKESGDATKYRSMLTAATNAEEMKSAEGRVNKQLEFETSMERVKSQIAILAEGPLTKMVDGLISLTENTGKLKALLAISAGLMAAMAASSVTMAIATTLATGGLSALTTAGIVGGVGLGVGTLAYTSMGDGLIAPSGQVLINTPEGMIKPSKNDYIGLSTNKDALFGGGGNAGSGKQEQLLAAILNAVQQPGGVYMDTNKVGTSLGMKYSSYA
jgi:hypothetical protein